MTRPDIEGLKALAEDCRYAAMPSKPDVVTLLGHTAARARDNIEAAIAYIEELEAGREKDREALRAADQFMTNGIELGYIRMPDPDTPDPAHNTPLMVRSRLEDNK